MTLKGLNTSFRLVVPDFDEFVVACCDEIGFIRGVVVVDMVDSLIMGIQSVVRCGGGEGPNFYGTIEARGCKCVRVFWVDSERHDIVCVAFEYPSTFPILVPIPELDSHVVRTGQYEGLSGMNSNTSNVTNTSAINSWRLNIAGCTLDGLRKPLLSLGYCN